MLYALMALAIHWLGMALSASVVRTPAPEKPRSATEWAAILLWEVALALFALLLIGCAIAWADDGIRARMAR